MQRRQIAIAGAGPAGLAAALYLHRDGHRVTLFEQFEAPQPLGSGLILQPTGLAVLNELGLGARMLSLGSRLDRLFGRAIPSGRIVLDVRYANLAGERFGLGVHRAALFNVLFDAVDAAAVPLETGRRVTGVAHSSDGRPILIREHGRRAGPFDLVVDALGVRSPLWPSADALLPGAKPRIHTFLPVRQPAPAAAPRFRHRAGNAASAPSLARRGISGGAGARHLTHFPARPPTDF